MMEWSGVTFNYLDNLLELKICGAIDTEVWCNNIGKIQTEINSFKGLAIVVDFSLCTSSVPVFITALFLYLVNSKKKVAIKMPSKNNECYRLLNRLNICELCEEHGFELSDDNNFFVSDRNDAVLYIFDVDTEDTQAIMVRLFTKIDIQQDGNQLFDKIRNILFETINNIREHAYENEEWKIGAICISKCKGLQRINQDKIIDAVFENSNKGYYYRNEYFYEICVVDAGIGVSSSLSIKTNTGDEVKYPFSQSMIRTFLHGERSVQKEYKSYYSGLKMIHGLLSEKNDYIYAREKDEFVSMLCADNSDLNRNLCAKDSKLKGVQWVFQLGIGDNNHGDTVFAKPIKNKVEVLELLKMISVSNCIDNSILEVTNIIDERENIKCVRHDISAKNKLKNIIWLMDKVYSKNKIYRQISDYLETYEGSNLLIGDVNDRMLTTIYYAIQKTALGKKTKFNNIIVVTHSFQIQVFVKHSDLFEYSPCEVEKYCNSIQDNPFVSFKAYIKFLINWDSILFWKTLFSKENKDRLLINGSIHWGEYTLDYYLNMEMILLERDLYAIIKNSLSRIGECVNGEIYYKSTDSIMKRLCIDLNAQKIDFMDNNNLYVESVYVTGKTDQMIELEDNDKKICIFKNVYLKGNGMIPHPDIVSLFLWPNRELIIENVNDNKVEMYRQFVGSAATKKSELDYGKLIEISRSKDNICRKDKETKDDIRELRGDFVKIGHFNYHNNHDLFSINQKKILRIDYYKRSKTFIFLLIEFIEATGIDYNNYLKQEWKVVVDKYYRKENKKIPAGLLVYRVHYYTSFVFDKIAECFLPNKLDVFNRVIPLDQMAEKSDNISFHVSEIVLENLQSLIEENAKNNNLVKITLFDTYSTTGKTLNDMEAIVNFAINKSKAIHSVEKIINKVVLIDCEKNDYEYTNNVKAYYHFEIPRLGTKNSCPLCFALKNANESKGFLYSEKARKRIDEWIKIWRAVSPIYEINYMTYNIERLISDTEEDVTVELLRLIEQTRLSNNRNYIYNYCSDKEMSAEKKVLFLTFQIMFFPPEDSYKDYNKTYSMLISEMNRIKKSDMITALAAIICLGMNKKTVELCIREIEEREEYLVNEDIKILFAIYFSKYSYLNKYNLYNTINSLTRFDKNDNMDLLKRFHSQLYNENGDVHSTRIEKLMKPFGDWEDLYNHCDSVYYSLEAMEKIINNINPLLVRTNASKVDARGELHLVKDKALDAINTGKMMVLGFKDTVQNEKREELSGDEKEEIEQKVLNPLLEYHRKLFVPCGKRDGNIGQPILSEIILAMNEAVIQSCINNKIPIPEHYTDRMVTYYDKNNKFECFVENNNDAKVSDIKRDVWYVWNQYAFEELMYLISDVRHSKGKIEHRTYDNRLAMYINYIIDDDAIRIKLHSMSEKSASEIEEKVNEKHRYQRSIIENYGIYINYESEKKANDLYELTTTIKLSAMC